jgi:hypothetical protein
MKLNTCCIMTTMTTTTTMMMMIMIYWHNNFARIYWAVFGPELCESLGDACYRVPDYRRATVIVYSLFQSGYRRQKGDQSKRETFRALWI